MNLDTSQYYSGMDTDHVIHQQISTIIPFLALRHGMLHVRDHDLSNIVLKLGDDGAGLHHLATNIGNGFMHTSRRRGQ